MVVDHVSFVQLVVWLVRIAQLVLNVIHRFTFFMQENAYLKIV